MTIVIGIDCVMINITIGAARPTVPAIAIVIMSETTKVAKLNGLFS